MSVNGSGISIVGVAHPKEMCVSFRLAGESAKDFVRLIKCGEAKKKTRVLHTHYSSRVIY